MSVELAEEVFTEILDIIGKLDEHAPSDKHIQHIVRNYFRRVGKDIPEVAAE